MKGQKAVPLAFSQISSENIMLILVLVAVEKWFDINLNFKPHGDFRM